MQFYWIAPIFLVAFKRGAKTGLAVWNVLFWTCIGVTLYVSIHYKFDANLFTNLTAATFQTSQQAQGPSYMDAVYDKPWTRAGPFLMGLLFAG